MMTEREKMIEIVLDTEITGIKIRNITGGISTANAIADALIDAGIGDVKKTKHRAEVAERALEERATYCAMEDFDCFSLTTVAVEARAKELYNGWVQQSEKELTKEERKDD